MAQIGSIGLGGGHLSHSHLTFPATRKTASSTRGFRIPYTSLTQGSSFNSQSLRMAFASGFKQIPGVSTRLLHPQAAALSKNPPAAVVRQSGATFEDQATEDLILSCTTLNVLAPIYKRLGGQEHVRESQFPEQWLPRNEEIVVELLAKKSSIVCLQELWLSNPELVELYDSSFAAEGYETFKIPRPNNRGDGLLTAVNTEKLEVVCHEELQFKDCGDRVAQFLWLRSKPGTCTVRGSQMTSAPACSVTGEGDPCVEMIVVNTHLLFPHDKTSSFIRLRQVYKVLETVEAFRERHGLQNVPVVLCGDLNGTKRGQVYNFLRSQGFVSSYDIATNQPDSDQRWVSHRNHHGIVCGVDFIWLFNPSEDRSSLALDWKAAVFSYITKKLQEYGCETDKEVFDFLCGGDANDDKPVITLDSIESAVSLIGSEMALSKCELQEMISAADSDGNGVVDFEEFQSVLQLSTSTADIPVLDCHAPHALEMPTPGICINGHMEKICSGRCFGNIAHSVTSRVQHAVKSVTGEARSEGRSGTSSGVGGADAGVISIAKASLYPPEAEQGIWPSTYTMSDHALLTAVFSLADLGLAAAVSAESSGMM